MKLAGSLPKGPADGLSLITQEMVDDPSRTFAVVALIDCKSLKTDIDTDEVEPTARVRHIEVVQGKEHLGLLRRIMRRSLENRTGRQVLPLSLEDEVAQAFRGIRVDKTTGEIVEDQEGQS